MARFDNASTCRSILHKTRETGAKNPARVSISYCHRLGHALGGYTRVGVCRRLALALMILIAFLRKHLQLYFVIGVSLRLGNFVLHLLESSDCGSELFSFPSLERLC